MHTEDSETPRGKTVLITGGASGLGAALGRTLAQAGADIVVGDVRTPMAEKAALALRKLPPETVIAEIMVLPMRESSWP